MTPLPSTPAPLQALRCLRLLLHFLFGAITVATVYPFIHDERRLWLKQRWSRRLLAILHVRLDAHLYGIAPGSLIVANHISWLDIHALNAARPMAFVAKAEIRCWPLIGWLAANADTVFIDRNLRRDASKANAQINRLLGADKDVAVFPEGTTTDGTQLLNFHSSLFQPAVDTGRPVQPVALSYHDAAGRRCTAPAHAGETTMGECCAAILACRWLTVRLQPTRAIVPRAEQRRDLARAAHGAIAFNLGLSVADEIVHHEHLPAGMPLASGRDTAH